MQVNLSNKTYDVLMVIAQIILPALGTLYATVSGILGLPATEQVLGIIAAVDTFLGTILKMSSAKYEPEVAGHIAIDDSGAKKVYQIQMHGDPEQVLDGKDSVVLSVGPGDLLKDTPKT
jgi:hypothetical protein